MRKILSLTLLLAITAQAQQVTTIPKGTPAPYDGVLFDKSSELQIRDQIIEAEGLAKKYSIVTEQNGILKEDSLMWRTRAQELAKEGVSVRNDSQIKMIGTFLMGAIVTTVVAFAVKGATK